ncbi:TPR-like protein [Serendipita vermifera]|nr:TPR-like protein [Serendipita vermifera]
MILISGTLLGLPYPPHPYLGENRTLCLRLSPDGKNQADARVVKSRFAGVWEVESSFEVPYDSQTLDLNLLVNEKGCAKKLISSTLKVSKLIKHAETRANEHYQFYIWDTRSPMEMMIGSFRRLKVFLPEPIRPEAISYETSIGDRNLLVSQGIGDLPARQAHLSIHTRMRNLPITERSTFLLSEIGLKYLMRYEEFHTKEDLELGIVVFEQLVRCSCFYPHFFASLYMLGNALSYRFELNGVYEDLERAILRCQDALRLTKDGDPITSYVLTCLGNCLARRFNSLGDVNDLNRAIAYLMEGTRLTPQGHRRKLTQLCDLGNVFRTRFHRLDNTEDIQKAISHFQTAVELTPNDDPNKPVCLKDLGHGFLIRFLRFHELEDIEKSVQILQTATGLITDDHPKHPSILNAYGIALVARFERLNDSEDLEKAVQIHKAATKLTPPGHPDSATQLNTLGITLFTRFNHKSDLEDLEETIKSLRIAIKLTPNNHPDKPGRLDNFASALITRFKHLGSLEDAEMAISFQQTAIQLTPDDHPRKAERFSTIGDMVLEKFLRLGGLNNADNAISYLQNAMEMTPQNHPERPSRLKSLGLALRLRFHWSSNLEDIEKAVSIIQTAVELMPDHHPGKLNALGDFGNALNVRFDYLGNMDDLKKATSYLEAVVEQTPKTELALGQRLSNLGGIYVKHFIRSDDLQYLQKGISSLQASVELAPDNYPGKASRLNDLGSAVIMRAQHLYCHEDVEKSISILQNAINLTPDDHPDKRITFLNLGIAFHRQFEHLGNREDAEKAISNMLKALELTPDGHSGRLSTLIQVGQLFFLRFQKFSMQDDLNHARENFSSAAKSSIGSPKDRFEAGLWWAQCESLAADSSPLEAYRGAVNLLPQIAWPGLSIPDQHSLLAEVGGAIRDAISAAIHFGELETAVEWAEQGRSIVWQHLLNLRTPLDELDRVHPDIAKRLHTVSRHLRVSSTVNPLSTGGNVQSGEQVASRHRLLSVEWDKIIGEIRLLPGFESFMTPKTFETLAPVAQEGPVVILSIAESRCDALVLISGHKKASIVNIPLENFSYKTSVQLLSKLKQLLSLAGVRARDLRAHEWVQEQPKDADMKNILGILWKHVARPVIDGLGYEINPADPPHIWWCATGPLAFLPIHAAGLYDKNEAGHKLTDYVISSYCPTLSALLESSGSIMSTDFRMLTVSQPSAPDAPTIPKTEEEVRRIQRVVPSGSIVNLSKQKATVINVLNEMKDSHWVHLACHGKQCVGKAMDSGLLLQDGSLHLSTIVREPLPKADFAFLSACETAMGDENVTEESAHLAAGMLLAGYRGVIATMWSINDDDAPQIAEDVYRRMIRDGKPNRLEAARALHEAVKNLKESGAGFLSWVPFIHIGR